MNILGTLKENDRVAILSPSSGLAGIFPWVADYGLKRLEGNFGLVPVEYPTTRQMGSSLKARAVDINDAFADKTIKAIFTMIGGEDQIQILKYLNAKVIRNNPKPFFGYSDNTHICNFLFNLGIPSFYGGSIMVEFGFNNKIPKETLTSLQWAISERGNKIIKPSRSFNTIGLSWAEKKHLNTPRTFEQNTGFHWSGSNNAEGILWGGCLESLIASASSRHDKVFDTLDKDVILFFETSEEMPPAWIIKYYLMGLGERKLFGKTIKGIVVGRPKTCDFDKQNDKEFRMSYSRDQIEAIDSTVRNYDMNIPIVYNVDIGHTAPQYIVPMGKICKINLEKRLVSFRY